jgi:hypothetical protein
MERALRILALLLTSTLAWRALHWYPLLPDPFPVHFNGAGEADGWASKSAESWALMALIGPLLAAGLSWLAASLPRLAAKDPGLINLQEEQRFMRLDEASRAVAVRPTAVYLRAVAVLVLGLFLYIIEGTGRMATGAWSTLPAWPVLLFVGGVIGGLPLLLRAMQRAMPR